MNKELIEILRCIDSFGEVCLRINDCLGADINCANCIIRNNYYKRPNHYPSLIIQIGNHLNE